MPGGAREVQQGGPAAFDGDPHAACAALIGAIDIEGGGGDALDRAAQCFRDVAVIAGRGQQVLEGGTGPCSDFGLLRTSPPSPLPLADAVAGGNAICLQERRTTDQISCSTRNLYLWLFDQ